VHSLLLCHCLNVFIYTVLCCVCFLLYVACTSCLIYRYRVYLYFLFSCLLFPYPLCLSHNKKKTPLLFLLCKKKSKKII
jgi:hypothetical protein